jgi:hypothetical protein
MDPRQQLAQMMMAGMVPPNPMGGQVLMAADRPALSPEQIRLNQLIYDRRLGRKRGDDPNDTYGPNAEIDQLRKIIKQMGSG